MTGKDPYGYRSTFRSEFDQELSAVKDSYDKKIEYLCQEIEITKQERDYWRETLNKFLDVETKRARLSAPDPVIVPSLPKKTVGEDVEA